MTRVSLILSVVFLLAGCVCALNSPRGVRGSTLSRIKSENALGRISERDLEVMKKEDDNKNQDNKDVVVEEAQGDEEEEEGDDEEEDEEETDEPTDPPKDDKEEDEEATDEPTAEVTDPEDEEPETDDMEEETTDETTSEPAVEETYAPVTNETVVLPPVDITNATMNTYTVDLAPFTIELDYEETIKEDPGIEEYLTSEMIAGGATNLKDIQLNLTIATVYGRRRLKSQVLYYTGTAAFVGDAVLEESEVLSLQSQALSDQQAVSNVIAVSLGEDPANFTVTSVVVEEIVVEPDGGDASASTGTTPPADESLSTTGLAIVLVAACVGAVSLTLICIVAMKKPESSKVDPYGGASRSLNLSTTQPVKTSAKNDAPEEGAKADLNKTFDTEDDQVHEEFAQNMEKHSFDGSWNSGPVQMQASVGRGSYHEVSEGEEGGDNPEDLKKELGEQLSELQASVKAAREKTQKLLDESKKGMQ